ncbi:MAG TPA: extracellular solute-binding protein [Actinomycetota bacterium]|nr:extracellular solute-binding protein [Actinomycetota bacterium]
MSGARALVAGLLLVLLACARGAPAPVATGPGSPGALTGELTFFAYEDSQRPEVMRAFEEANPALRTRYAAFSSGDEAIAKLRGGFRADVVEICVEDTRRMIELGLIQPIDPARIADWDRCFPALRELDGVVVDGRVWLVPEQAGTSGIVYDPEAVPGGVDSYRQLFTDPALRGRVTFEDTAATTMAVAALALGYEDPWALSPGDVERVGAFLIEHKAQIRTLFKGDSDFLNLYRSGEIAAGFGYPDYELAAREEGVPAEFVFAREGQLTWVCGYGLGAGAQNLDAAYALLNHHTSPAVQRFYAEEYHYLISNQRTLELLDEDLIRRVGLEHPEELQRAIPLKIPEDYDLWLEAWRAFKAA